MSIEIVRTRSAGGIVIGNGSTIALVQSRATGYWTFPKGHPDGEETDEEAARREIAEEAGLLELEYLDDLGEYERPRLLPDGTDDPFEIKAIRMFLFAAPRDALLAPTMEIQAAEWVHFRQVAERVTIPRDRVWFASVARRVLGAIQRD